MAQRKLRILCFGDSLTTGWLDYGAVLHPYKKQLVRELEAAFPGSEIEATVDGLPGGLTAHFPSRLVKHFSGGGKPYDWTIVLGGTNDIGTGWTGEQAFENLAETWNVALSRRSKVLALTVPECHVSTPRLRQLLADKREAVNSQIRTFKRPNFYVCDFHDAFPYFALSASDRSKYYDDGLHFTVEGYNRMGSLIAGAMIDIINREDGRDGGVDTGPAPSEVGVPKAEKEPLQRPHPEAKAGPSKPARKKRAFKDDDTVFVEEAGPPTAISKGYVAVRRKDLD